MEQPPVGKASNNEMAMMREWSKTYGVSVRQRNVRQETTMAKAGTLPDYLYQKDLHVSEKVEKVVLSPPLPLHAQSPS